jgi:hypothetical protein
VTASVTAEGGLNYHLTGGNGAAQAAVANRIGNAINSISEINSQHSAGSNASERPNYKTSGPQGPERFTDEQRTEIRKTMDVAVSDSPAEGFELEETAAKYLRTKLQGIAENYDIEIGSYIFSDDGGASYQIWQPITEFRNEGINTQLFPPRRGHAPFHTHQTDNQFSGQDLIFAERSGANSYLSNTQGLIRYRARDRINDWKLYEVDKRPRPNIADYIEWVR